MVTLRKRDRNSEAPANSKEAQNDKTPASSTQEQEGSGYEQFREKRIRENMERLHKLGVLDLSLKLKSSIPTPKCTSRNTLERKAPNSSLLLPSEPPRRSSRLQVVDPVSYSELLMYYKGISGSLDGYGTSHRTRRKQTSQLQNEDPSYEIRHSSLLLPSGPPRRSPRLQNVDPIKYSELSVNKEDKSGPLDDNEEPWILEGL